ncbi:MlaD family protein [Gordonia sp. LSe1-13]|uniref:MlaD family protein n=1 Tax=Gordonia sesuvii TaxID=3116777 RepID=A0ABU7MAB4_9ACTN|nr:MlaD family protein [Gordonia sp. LSe1-13]
MRPSAPVISLAAIVAVLLGSIVYLCAGVLDVNPTRQENSATVLLPDSAGLAVGSPVLLTGYEIGEVTELRSGDTGASATILYRDDFRIPTDSALAVQTLSALGEPYLEFTPEAPGGPYLADGEVIRTSPDEAPTSISQTATDAVALLRQMDPDVISRLVGTFSTALADTDPVIPQLGRSTQLLAVTVLSRLPNLAQLLEAVQSMGRDVDWMGPTLRANGPAWNSVGGRVIEPLDREMANLAETRPPSAYTTGDGLVPFLDDLKATLVRLGPSLQPLGPMLQPLVTKAAPGIAQLDIGELVAQAVRMVGSDNALRFHIDITQPAGK